MNITHLCTVKSKSLQTANAMEKKVHTHTHTHTGCLFFMLPELKKKLPVAYHTNLIIELGYLKRGTLLTLKIKNAKLHN